MEFVLIRPGQMQEAVFQPSCPSTADPAVPPKPGGTVDPRILWTPADLALCQKLLKQDSSAGVPVAINKPFYIG